jgi:hypothetical protein
MKSTYAIAATLAVMISASASAQAPSTAPKTAPPAAPTVRGTPPARTDAGCILVANLFASQLTNQDQKALAQNVLFFYFGRLDGRAGEAQMKTELRQARSTQLTNDTAGALMNSCAQGMQGRAKVFEGIMQQLGPSK